MERRPAPCRLLVSAQVARETDRSGQTNVGACARWVRAVRVSGAAAASGSVGPPMWNARVGVRGQLAQLREAWRRRLGGGNSAGYLPSRRDGTFGSSDRLLRQGDAEWRRSRTPSVFAARVERRFSEPVRDVAVAWGYLMLVGSKSQSSNSVPLLRLSQPWCPD